MKYRPEQRAIMWFSKFANGKRLSESPNGEVQDLQEHANLDLVWLSRIARAHGNIFPDLTDCSRNGCEWLIPFGVNVELKALTIWLNKHTETEEDLKKVIEDSSNIKQKFVDIWLIPIKDIVHIEYDNTGILDFHLEVKSHLINLDGTIKERNKSESFNILIPDRWEDMFKKTKSHLIDIAPYKFYKSGKEDTHDVAMWDGREFTDLRNESIDKLLMQEGYSFRMKDYYEYGSAVEIEKEIEDKRIIRSFTIKQTKQKALSKTAYFTKIHRVAKMSMLIQLGIVGIKIIRDDKNYLQDKYWYADDYPNLCRIHLIPEIVKIVPFMTESASKHWSTHKVDSVRSAEALFDDIKKEFSLEDFYK